MFMELWWCEKGYLGGKEGGREGGRREREGGEREGETTNSTSCGFSTGILQTLNYGEAELLGRICHSDHL